MKNTTISKGFTLLEILLVVGIISILAGIVIVAINPGRQLAQAHNVERISDLKQINSALQQYYIDHSSYPGTITSTLTEVCNTGGLASSSLPENFCNGKIDLSVLVPMYITAIPSDPQVTINASSSNTDYKVIRYSSSGKIGLKAESAERGEYIAINVPPDPCDTDPEPGTVCDDSTVYVNATLRTTPSDVVGTFAWSTESYNTNADSSSDGAGNTAILEARALASGQTYAAARACYDSSFGGHSDWYLPAKDELQILYQNNVAIKNFNTSDSGIGGSYWSSTEHPWTDLGGIKTTAYFYHFNWGSMEYAAKNTGGFNVRCVRSL